MLMPIWVVSQEDPHRTVTAFIDLIQRHEQSFYHFVHKVHSKGENLFDSLMRWIELFLTVVREGLGTPISLEFLLPHTGKERTDILNEVDKVALYHYKLKVVYEDKLRRRFGKVQNSADAEDEATQALVNGVVGEIDFGELIQGDADDLAAEETDEESGDEESSEYETSSGEESDDDSSEESDEGSGDSAEGRASAEKPRHPTVVRSQTARAPARAPSRPPVADPKPPIPRQRSLSLRSSRSMNFSLNNLSLGRRSHDVPPVPPLPTASKSANAGWEKPLPPPPSPNGRSTMERAPPTPSKLGHEPPKAPPKPKSKPKKAGALKPPELQHIPQLLPVFVEMVR